MGLQNFIYDCQVAEEIGIGLSWTDAYLIVSGIDGSRLEMFGVILKWTAKRSLFVGSKKLRYLWPEITILG